MFSHTRLMLQFAALASVAALLSTAPSAVAAESTIAAAATTKTAPSVVNRHASRGTRVAASRFRDESGVSKPGCSGDWCGRQFVLMVGIGY